MKSREDKERERELRRQIDEVVGTDFDAPHVNGFGNWLRARWFKWALGVVFAVAAMLIVVYTILSHTRAPAPPAKKPVPVQIIPAR